MSYPKLELIMLCEMCLNFESVDDIPKWIKPKLEREIAHGGGGGGKKGGGRGGGGRGVCGGGGGKMGGGGRGR